MNYKDIKKLISDMGSSKLNSLDIEFPDGIKISMTKDQNNIVNQKNEVGEFIIDNDDIMLCEDYKIEETEEEEYYLIKSPMVGIFYSRSAPDKEPFVKIGDSVIKGIPLCIVEAMKLMNEIEAEYDGEIVDICVKDEEMVEYGQILFKIRKTSLTNFS